jgi:hypothetical protein
MDKAKLTAVFNLGFRSGANDRAAAGLVISGTTTPPPPAHVPGAPAECTTPIEQKAWQEGYTMGFTMGASNAELASQPNAASHGMVSGLNEEMVEMFGVFKRLAKAH